MKDCMIKTNREESGVQLGHHWNPIMAQSMSSYGTPSPGLNSHPWLVTTRLYDGAHILCIRATAVDGAVPLLGSVAL